jgi:hypothetical protein
VTWQSLFVQSLFVLTVQHGVRLWREPGTRTGLRGAFWRDYANSAGNLSSWRDGDPFPINYIAHPIQGAAYGFIWVQNDLGFRELAFLESGYWNSRFRAMLWSAVLTVNFEIGPYSEASLGNVGTPMRHDSIRNGGMGAVDMVITPLVGTAWLVGEDAIDWHLIRKIEAQTQSRVLRALARGLLNPARTFANAVRFKPPWHRDSRDFNGLPPVARRPAEGSAQQSAHRSQ